MLIIEQYRVDIVKDSWVKTDQAADDSSFLKEMVLHVTQRLNNIR